MKKSWFNITNFFLIILSITFSGNCRKNAVINVDDAKKGPYVTRADGAHLYSGRYRAQILWPNKDPNVKTAKVYWNNYQDSLTYPVTASMDSVKIIINNLEEGDHKFDIFTYDANQVSSGKTVVSGYVFGDYYSKLRNKPLSDTLYYSKKNTVELTWSKEKITDAIFAEVIYNDTEGKEQRLLINNNDSLTVVPNISKISGGSVKYRTAYWLKNVIDTLYAPYTTLPPASTTFTNPIFRGADPWIAQKDSMYYMTYTGGLSILIRASKKVFGLGNAEPIRVWTPPSGTAYSSNIWAPELHEINGKWYIYFAADDGNNANHRMYVIENASGDPLSNNWVFKGQLTDPTNEWAIDGSIFTYKNQMYTVWSGGIAGAAPQYIYIAKMSNPWTISGNRVAISSPTLSWEKNGSAINEGPQPLFNPYGKLFIVYSASGFWTDNYCLGLLTLKDNGDPMKASDWTKTPTPVFAMNAASKAYGPGHNGFFKSPDGTEDWIIYHARTDPGGGDTNYRNIRMQKFTWSSTGAPVFGTPVAVGVSVAKPSGAY